MGVNNFDVTSLTKAKIYDPREVGYKDSIEIIYEELHKTRQSFVKIGWYLKHIYEEKMYAEDGYADIYELAKDKFDISQSTTTRFMNLCSEFSVDHDSPELDRKYIDFSISQLFEMLPMEQEEKAKIDAGMTIREIREIKRRKKEDKDTEEGDISSIPGQTSIEADFPEYMPEAAVKVDMKVQEDYATSHKDQEEELDNKKVGSPVIDGAYREVEMLSPIIPEETTQPELPVLKNADQRKEWLKNYKDWGIWYRDENIDVNYYKFDFFDGSRLVVTEYPQRHSYYSNESKDEHYYHLLKKNTKRGRDVYDEKYRCQPDCETDLVEFLKNIQKKER